MNIDTFEAFPWDDNLNTGIDSIDKQHKVLVNMLNKLASNLSLVNEDGLSKIFDELVDYANMHFVHEEKIWKTYFEEDSLFKSHQSTHAFFNTSIAELKKKSGSDTFHETTEKVVKYLIRWLAFHIMHSDKLMALTIEAIKEGSSVEEAKNIADKKLNSSSKVLIESILNIYDGLSSRTIALIKERRLRKDAEKKVLELTQKLEDLNS